MSHRAPSPGPAARPSWLVPAFCAFVGGCVMIALFAIAASLGGTHGTGTNTGTGTGIGIGTGIGTGTDTGTGTGTDGGGGGAPSTVAVSPVDGGSTDAAAQAAAVNQILRASATSRGELPSDLETCDGVSGSISTLESIAGEREQQLGQAQNLTVDGLDNGDELRSALVDALQASLDADRAYLSWARSVQGCSGDAPTDDADHDQAVAADERAGEAKDRVVAAWRPTADRYGLPSYSDGRF